MNITTKELTKVNVEELIQDLLGLDPAKLATMNPTPGVANDEALLGLQAFMRRILELAVTLGDHRHLKIYLKSEETARRDKFPDARSANFGMLCLWSAIMEQRYWKGLGFATLEPVPADGIDPPVQIDRRVRRMSISALIAELQKPIVVDPTRVGSGEQTFPVSAHAMVREQLKIDPAMLMNGFSKAEADFDKIFAGKPDAQARAGLGLLLLDAFAKFWVMRTRRTTKIRLLSDSDAAVVECYTARAVNMSTLLAAALHNDEVHEVFFAPPCERTPRDYAVLQEAAKLTYRDFSEEALQGLELICDGVQHFGCRGGFTIAERLLYRAAEDEDPQFERMPPVVAQQHEWELRTAGAAVTAAPPEAAATFH